MIIIFLTLLILQPLSMQAVEVSEVDQMIEKHMNDVAIPGIAVGVIKNNDEFYFKTKGITGQGEDLKPDSPMFIGSLSKSVTALGAMLLVDKGVIDLDDPVQEYIPYFQVKDPEHSQAITVRHLLNQTSGLSRKNYVPSSDYDFTLEQRVKALSDFKAVSESGQEFHYFNDNFNILGLVIEKASGQSFAAYMKNNVFRPLGMNNTTADVEEMRAKNINGYTNIFGFSKSIEQKVPRYDIPSGYILSTPADMNKYLKFFIDPKTEILSQEAMDIMLTAAADSDYGMGLHINEANGQTVVKHSGAVPGFSSHIVFLPETESGFFYVMNKNHLIHNFTNVYNKLNGNLLQVTMSETSFDYFPSIWLIRIISLVLIILTLKDVLDARKVLYQSKTKQGWLKESIKSILLTLFLIIGLPYILRNILGLSFNIRMMLGYTPDFAILLFISILVQILRSIVSVYCLLTREENESLMGA